jgi:pyridoxal phosphate-dependent aminotransferase EpsN
MRPTLRREKRILLSVPHMGGTEIKYVLSAFESNWLSTVGPNLSNLEKRFSELVGLPSVALANGTAGIHLGLKLLGIKQGDEVVTPTLTFAASCNPLLYEKAAPVFIDSERASWNLDPQLLADFLRKRAKKNKLPKAVTVVHLFGQPADMDSIMEICNQYELPVLEDAAECLGARYKDKHPGTIAHVGVYSFNGNKIITGTTGGMLVAQRQDWVDKARYWSTQARDPDPLGVNNYMHSEVGYNYRMSNVVAGIVLGQLEVLEFRVKQRRAIFERYKQAFADLPGIEPMPELKDTLPTHWLSCFLIDERRFGLSATELIKYLDTANVETRPVWKPMHTQKLYQGYECIGGAVAEELNKRGICLPSSSSMTEDEQEFVIHCVRSAAGSSQ